MTGTKEALNLAEVPEEDRLAFYGALFAMAAADNSVDREEMNLIFEVMELDGMSESGKRKAQGYLIEPPPIQESLRALSAANEALRYGVMINLVDVAMADDILEPDEDEAVHRAQRELGIAAQHMEEIRTFVRKLKRIREQGLEGRPALDAMKEATSGLTAVGIPVAAVYFSGSVIGLSAAGITSGLAALGLGLGMVPGIGVAVLLGAGLYVGMRTVLDAGDKRKKDQVRLDRERKAQLIIRNLQQAMDSLVERIQALQGAAADAEANREAILKLNEQMRALQQLLAKRKRSLEGA